MTERSNQQWLDELRGTKRKEAQRQAIIDLYEIIATATLSYLKYRRKINNPYKLAEFDLLELCGELSRGILLHIQDDSFALLNKYSSRGSFKGWIASVCQNELRTELRKPPWNKPHTSYDDYAEKAADKNLASNDPNPEQVQIQQEKVQLFKQCWEKLSANEQAAIDGKSQGIRSAKIAQTILGATADQVDMWRHRGKKS